MKHDGTRAPELTGPAATTGSPTASLRMARALRDHAYAPYSEYRVGAVIVTDQGAFPGVNIEVSGRSTSIHAEMMAVFNAVMNGATRFEYLALSASNSDAPCGLCQHTLAQFSEDLEIYVDTGTKDDDSGFKFGAEYKTYSLLDLIGDGYAPSSRKANRDVMEKFDEDETDVTANASTTTTLTLEPDPAINDTLEANERAWEEFLNGDDRAGDYLVGQIVDETSGRMDPGAALDVLETKRERHE